ncbi:peptide chain release factor N(5)-glutamine methyltransferase [Roseibacterium sp. SDUM158016]|uniref:peptide chain release factor N(5)-glutamine methyltransferase n=1 Tax=Roseicyclus sediminis TaxID=2980997 RepID=UPI0021D3A48A|nr:peptide chain release factor N(5)-glutamine methyltransferase [Roseibacterium sp. SDUM158016]MCU4655152.1 peptide chain release factor N(5)-glutamine methyltransferase [Roseibacterium sp. SDUM158016]
MRVADWLRGAVARLAPLIGAEEARRDSRLLLAAATGWSAARLAASGGDPLPAEALTRADAFLDRRAAREPTAQILGEWSFFGRPFAVSRDVLTPRPDTEALVEAALAAPFSRLLDLGTGSGILAVTLLAERPAAMGLATDISAAALAVAGANAARHGVAGRLQLAQGDWWAAVPDDARFDLIVSNPPYVTGEEYGGLAPEIRDFEPRGALTPGGDGLSAYRAILAGAPAHLSPGGRLAVEIGAGQGADVAGLFRGAGLEDVAIGPDLSGRDRIVTGRIEGVRGS